MVPALATEGTIPMSKLSDTQSIILSAAAQRADGNVLPLPGSLRGGAATKVVGALLARGLIREHVVDSPRKADAAMNTIWRNLPEPDGRGVLLFITAAGAEAIGIEPEAVPYAFNEGTNSAGEPAAGAPTGADEAPVESAPKRRGRPRKAAPTARDTARLRARPATAPSRRSWSRCSGASRAPPSRRSSRPPAGSRTPCAAPSPGR